MVPHTSGSRYPSRAPALPSSKGGYVPNNEDFVDKILNAVNNLVKLRISTIVEVAGSQKKIETEIDLLQGDINTTMSDDFITGDYVVLREFHQKREEQGQRIIQDNVEALTKLLKLFSEARSKQGALTTGPPPPPAA